jgi:hypothetical protein
MPMLRLPGRCIVFVPISPDGMKILYGGGSGYAGSSRDAALWVDHLRWSRRGRVALISRF